MFWSSTIRFSHQSKALNTHFFSIWMNGDDGFICHLLQHKHGFSLVTYSMAKGKCAGQQQNNIRQEPNA